MQPFQVFQSLAVAGEAHTFRQLDVEHQNVQLPLGGHLGILLPQRTGGGISGIGEGLLPVFLQRRVQGVEGLLGHVDLPPDDEPGRGVFQRHWDGADGAQILRHILAHIAIATGGTPDELAVHVFQCHGQAIDFRLHRKFRVCHRLLGVQQKVIQLFHAEHILKAHQRHRVSHLGEGIHRLTAHPPGWRIRPGILRMGFFQLLQLPQGSIVFKIQHGGIIQDVVFVVRLGQYAGQLVNSVFRIHKFLRFVKKCWARCPR